MSGTVTAVAVLSVLNLLFGVALGWYLRRANTWCPGCGDRLTCSGCGRTTAWVFVDRKERHRV